MDGKEFPLVREFSNLTKDDFAIWNYSDFRLIWEHLPLWEAALKVTPFVPLILLGVLGNLSIVTVVACGGREMRSCTNLFISNMALADLLTSALSTWIFLVKEIYQNYILGEFFCKAGGFIQVICLLSSVFSLMVISMDRLLSIIRPLKTRLTKRCASAVILAIWIASGGTAYPLTVWREYHERQWNDYLEKYCTEDVLSLKYYWLVVLILLFYLPLCIMTLTYSFIILRLDRYRNKFCHCPGKLSRRKKVHSRPTTSI